MLIKDTAECRPKYFWDFEFVKSHRSVADNF
jgi:hypothetical protein